MLAQSYDEIITTRILDPLGMTATHAGITHTTRKRLAVGYVPFYDDRPAAPADGLVPATWVETNTGDGCLATTPADLAAFLRMLLNRGEGAQDRILSPASFELMTQRVIEFWNGVFYGYGLNIGTFEGHTCIGHSGSMIGYAATMLGDLDEGIGVVAMANRDVDLFDVAVVALHLLRAMQHHHPLPALPLIQRSAHLENAAEYMGTYTTGTRTVQVVAEQGAVVLHDGDARIVLDPRGGDQFYVDHPNYRRFLWQFGRHNQVVVEAFYGPDWYTNERYTGRSIFAAPGDWEVYPGHYRSHNPWASNFRVVRRKDALFLIRPSGEEERLVQLADAVFRIGEDEGSPERIRFDTLVGSQALRANVSGCDYYRFFTP